MTAPEPLVPAACSMAGNDWFPLHFDRLRKSKWWRRASDLARARNVMLWGEAYKQVPAGSMPDDDDDLAEAAGFGMDVDGFLAAKAEIMAPWVMCSDGRWYHPTVCEVVLEVWEKASERRKAAAEKKAAQRAKTRGQAPRSADVPPGNANVPEDTANVPRDSAENGRDIDTHNREDNTGQTRQTPQPPEGAGALFGEDASAEEIDEVREAFDTWNAMADRCGLPRAKVLDEGRRRAIRKRLEDGGGLDAWRRAVEAVARSRHCRGENDRQWKADLDFVCQPKSWRRLLEGTYGDDAPPPAEPRKVEGDPWPKRIAAYRRNAYWNRLEWGPPPGKPGCALPPETQMAHGYTPAANPTQNAA